MKNNQYFSPYCATDIWKRALWVRGRYFILIQEKNRSQGLVGAKNKAKERIYPKISALNEYKIHFAFDIDSAIESHFWP